MDDRENPPNGKQLIDVDTFLEKMMKRTIRYFDVAFDAVEVVRCRECKHCDPENHHCDHHIGTVAPLRREPDGFCSYGERKEGADNGKVSNL